MSNYFTKNNTIEVGPGPTEAIEWLIVQDSKNINGVTQCAVVKAQTAFFALQEAEKLIPEFKKQDCVCYPSPVMRMFK